MTDRDQRIAEALAALQAAAEAGIDVESLARFVATTTPAERIARADVSESRLAEAEGEAYLMDALRALLRATFAGPDLARAWLDTSLPASLGGQTPAAVLRDGGIARVIALLEHLARGA
jgi:hypothetical protein